MDFGGKRHDVVDIGGEVDYEGYQWFQDAPPRPQQESQTTSTPYVPLPGVIELNDQVEYALQAAPNVLYGQYKQYGQLGVLSWGSEFSELIDNLKDLGIQGNMFVTTRQRALECCKDVLKLLTVDLDIEMQIIVLYLCSQVARLRRFLDSEGHWEDYPQPKFPIEPRIYPPPFGTHGEHEHEDLRR